MAGASPTEIVDDFIEAFDARQFEPIAALFRNGVATADGASPWQIFHELQLRSPWTSLVRGDLDGDPVAIIWVPDELGEPQPVGYVSFDTYGGVITGIGIHGSLPGGLDQKADAGTLVSTEPGVDGHVKDTDAG